MTYVRLISVLAFASPLALGAGCACESGPPVVEEGTVPARCFDGMDNDGDGLTDCADPGCSRIPACTGEGESDCGDGLDNDANGFADCSDFGCASDPVCRDGGT